MILLFGARRSGKTLLCNSMTSHQTHSCEYFDEYEGKANTRIVDVHQNVHRKLDRYKSFTQKLARRFEQHKACLVTCPRDARDFESTRNWLTFTRKSFPQNPIALVVTKSDLNEKSKNLGDRFGVRYEEKGDGVVMSDSEFETKLLDVMTQSYGADRLFYTSAVCRTGVRDVENWLLDVTNADAQFVGFGDTQSRQDLLGRKLFRKKSRRDESCVGVNCEKCVLQ